MRLIAVLGLALVACGGRAEDGRSVDIQPDAGSASGSGSGGRAAEGGAGNMPADAGSAALDASSGGEDGGGRGGATGEAGAGGVTAQCPSFATSVADHAFGGGQNHGQATAFPSAVLGPPVANDASSVVSLGNGGWVALAFGGGAIVDGLGVDFTVFENPLGAFKELATVAVSEDGETWTEFPCTAMPVTGQPTDYGNCAGVRVVYSSPKNGIDPRDPAVSGGDHYDLADIGLTRARFVRITDREDLVGNDGVFDLDAVAVIHAECE